MNLRSENTTENIGGKETTVTVLFQEDKEVTAVWELDGLTYWEDGGKGTVCTGSIHDFADWLTKNS